MSLENLISRPVTGVRAFNELPVDAAIWNEAHNHHQRHRQIHAAGAHRPGIVQGLEVMACRSNPREVIVAPGVAVDARGRSILLTEPVRLPIMRTRQIYIVLQFVEFLDKNSAVTVGEGQECYRLVEGHDLSEMSELPHKPHIRLAEIFRTGADQAIQDAKDPFAPGTNELNLLFRPLAFPYCFADVAVGELSYVPTGPEDAVWHPNRAGLWSLLREGNGRGFHPCFNGIAEFPVPEHSVEPALLYLAGEYGFEPLPSEDIEGLRRFVLGGGVLFGEACAGSEAFQDSFQNLAQQLGCDLRLVGPGHPLLTAHHTFSAPPAGARSTGALLADAAGGVYLSTYNYGGAWQGRIERPESSDARDRIRQAEEFGMNVVAFASARWRRTELYRLER